MLKLSPWSRTCFSGVCCPSSLLLESVTHGGCWGVIQHGLKLFAGALVLWPPGMCRPRTATTFAMSGATHDEQQRDLQMAVTCAELGGS